MVGLCGRSLPLATQVIEEFAVLRSFFRIAAGRAVKEPRASDALPAFRVAS
ncbi:MAG: hypothetical protein H0X25_07410 [Acidobacteriales bacterium]|nr:hypothetical protein [Terriglobales bacterium]